MSDDAGGKSALQQPVRPAAKAPRWWHCDTHGPGTVHAWGCPECVREMRVEIERLRAALEVSQAATDAAIRAAQWQARTNGELNALQDEVRKLRGEACRRLNDEFGD